MPFERTVPNRIGPVTVPGNQSVEFNIVSDNPISRVNVEPYLSLNRGSILVNVPDPKQDLILSCDDRPSFAQSTWYPSNDKYILIDDLDDGFSVTSAKKDATFSISWLNPFTEQYLPNMDQGLPVSSFLASKSNWSRQTTNFAFGRYRKTTAQILARDEDSNPLLYSSFQTDIPESGIWEIEFHLPIQQHKANVKVRTMVKVAVIDSMGSTGTFNLGNHGTYQFRLINADKTEHVEFDASTVSGGWHVLGRFELQQGPAELHILNENSGSVVYSDAVRYRHVGAAFGIGHEPT